MKTPGESPGVFPCRGRQALVDGKKRLFKTVLAGGLSQLVKRTVLNLSYPFFADEQHLADVPQTQAAFTRQPVTKRQHSSLPGLQVVHQVPQQLLQLELISFRERVLLRDDVRKR